MRNIKVLPHHRMVDNTEEYGVFWSSGLYSARMARQLAWRMDMVAKGCLKPDLYTFKGHSNDTPGVMIQLDSDEGKIMFVHSSEVILCDGIPHIYGFHWEGEVSPAKQAEYDRLRAEGEAQDAADGWSL